LKIATGHMAYCGKGRLREALLPTREKAYILKMALNTIICTLAPKKCVLVGHSLKLSKFNISCQIGLANFTVCFTYPIRLRRPIEFGDILRATSQVLSSISIPSTPLRTNVSGIQHSDLSVLVRLNSRRSTASLMQSHTCSNWILS
jgi:hypothetical protein